MSQQQPQRTSSTDSADAIRKRVCKACDRCRLKKSKCDGSHPCTRCKADNAICVFGERKKSHDKVYPKGYVEMLEQQQDRLVSALQEMYRRARRGEPWSDAAALLETNGQPLTHDILAGLGLLEPKHDGSGDLEHFEEDYEKIQARLVAEGAGYVHRRGSFSSDSDHSHGKSTPQQQYNNTPPRTKQQPIFNQSFTFTPSPSQSPPPRQRQSYPQPKPSLLHRAPPLTNADDPQLFQPDWTSQNFAEPETLLRSNFAMRTPRLEQSLDQLNDLFTNGGWNDGLMNGSAFDMVDYSSQQQQQFTDPMGMYAAEYTTMGPASAMDLDQDFKQFIQVST